MEQFELRAVLDCVSAVVGPFASHRCGKDRKVSLAKELLCGRVKVSVKIMKMVY